MNDSAPALHRLNSSLRIRPISESLKYAQRLAPLRGISRVTDTTPLDRIGIPVFASVRPGAMPGSLCVNAGKGLLPDEARIGAYMEAIEFSYAEEGGSLRAFEQITVAEMLASHRGELSLLDFCPLMGARAELSDPIKAIRAEMVGQGCEAWVPAELAFMPFASGDHNALFSHGHSIGLASGNSVEEASVHALAELIEHDIASFEFIRDTSRLVDTSELSGAGLELARKIQAAGLSVCLRNVDNAFGIPFFHALVMESSPTAPVNICAGFGVHPIKELAAVRALAEAAQSRLTTIHGGRDDLSKYPQTWGELGRERELAAIAEQRSKFSNPSRSIAFADIPDWSDRARDLPSAWRSMVEALERNGMTRIARVVFTEPHDDLHVVKLIVPRMEACEHDALRFGPRLRSYIESL